jgi:hypothetical protein
LDWYQDQREMTVFQLLFLISIKSWLYEGEPADIYRGFKNRVLRTFWSFFRSNRFWSIPEPESFSKEIYSKTIIEIISSFSNKIDYFHLIQKARNWVEKNSWFNLSLFQWKVFWFVNWTKKSKKEFSSIVVLFPKRNNIQTNLQMR